MSTAAEKANLARIRDNQRRSRARRKEYLQELEGRLRLCETHGIEASAEVQFAARAVAEENKKLRAFLHQNGYDDAAIEGILVNSVTVPGLSSGSAVSGLEMLLSKKRPNPCNPTHNPDTTTDKVSGRGESRDSSVSTAYSTWDASTTRRGSEGISSAQQGQSQQYGSYRYIATVSSPSRTSSPNLGHPSSMSGSSQHPRHPQVSSHLSALTNLAKAQPSYTPGFNNLSFKAGDSMSPAIYQPQQESSQSRLHLAKRQLNQSQMNLHDDDRYPPDPGHNTQDTNISSCGVNQMFMGGQMGGCSRPSNQNFNNPNTNSCVFAADLITSMSDSDPAQIRTELGCVVGGDCQVDNQLVFDVMDRHSGTGAGLGGIM